MTRTRRIGVLAVVLGLGLTGGSTVGASLLTRALAGEPAPPSVERPAVGCPVAGTAANGDATPEPSDDGCEVVQTVVDFAFTPAAPRLPVGATLTWVNVGPTLHTVASTDQKDGGRLWDSNIMAVGDVYSYTFNEPGTYEYLCALHPEMTAEVEVVGAAP